MKKTAQLKSWILLIAVITLSACGGGGGATTQPATATVKLSFSGATSLYGIDATVALPAGVTLRSTTNPPQTDSGVVLASGATITNTLVAAVYTAATSSSAATARIMLVNANGFSAGEFCTVNADIAAGYTPNASDFSITNFAASDRDGNVLSGLTPSYTATVQ